MFTVSALTTIKQMAEPAGESTGTGDAPNSVNSSFNSARFQTERDTPDAIDILHSVTPSKTAGSIAGSSLLDFFENPPCSSEYIQTSLSLTNSQQNNYTIKLQNAPAW